MIERVSPTTPQAAEQLRKIAEGAEAYSEPSGTGAQELREGATNPEGGSQPEDEAKQQRLEQTRAAMWEAPQVTGGGGK